ncbi:MAG: hypothetical protein LBG94_05435, partial [Treponema sp.]|nr:hypothetical protein [Treponema sp.]
IKRKLNLTGIAVLTAFIALSITACPDGYWTGGKGEHTETLPAPGLVESIWTAIPSGEGAGTSTFDTSTIYGIAYGNNKFVAVGVDGKMAYSED